MDSHKSPIPGFFWELCRFSGLPVRRIPIMKKKVGWKSIFGVAIVGITLQNCTAWPAITALAGLMGGAKGGSPMLFFPMDSSSQSPTTQSPINEPTPGTTLVRLDVTSTNPNIPKGRFQQLRAIAIYSDSESIDVTETAEWEVEDTNRLELQGAKGRVRARNNANNGSGKVRARYQGSQGEISLTVVDAVLESLEINPSSIQLGTTDLREFQITALYSNGTQNITDLGSAEGLTLTNSNPGSVHLFPNSFVSDGTRKRRIRGESAGTSTITANFGGLSAILTVNVSAAITLERVEISPQNPSALVVGDFRNFTLTAVYSDNSTQNVTNFAVWSSSATGNATFDSDPGRLRAVSAGGPITLTASYNGFSHTTQISIAACTLANIAITPVTTNLASPGGDPIAYTATGSYTEPSCPAQDITSSVIWTSSNTAIASISNVDGSRGRATALASGTTNISAEHSSVTSNTATLTVQSAVLQSLAVTPANPSISVNQTIQFTSTGTYNYGANQSLTSSASCTWSSSDPTKATVSNAMGTRGVVATFSATGPEGIDIIHTCGSVTNSTKLVITTATLLSVVVTPVNPNLPIGFTQQFTSVGIYSDNSTQILTTSGDCTWISTTPASATISNTAGTRGVATPVAAGTTTIRHSCHSGSVVGETHLTVTNATLLGVAVSPINPTIANGTIQQFTAIGTFSDNTTLNLTNQVTWTSLTPANATITNGGLATALNPGTTVIRATHGALQPQTTLTVTNATLSSIQVTPVGPVVAIGFGTTQSFTATGNYSDGSTQNITNLVTWTSGSTGVATISNNPTTHGIATSVSAGITNIQANLGGTYSNIAQLDVRMITLVSINVTPANTTVDAGGTRQLFATGVYNDGTQQDLTTQLTWNTSPAPTAIAVVSNTPGTMGTVTGTGTNGQSVAITATRAGVTGTTNVTIVSDVTPPTLVSAVLQAGNIVRVTYSEPVNVTQATNAGNYKIALTSLIAGTCGEGTNFASSPAAPVSVSSVGVVSQSVYLLQLSAGTASTSYTVLVDKPNVRDLANNTMGCSNSATFIGEDTIAPTISSVTSVNATTVRVTFSEPVNETQARTAGNYKIVNSPAIGTCSPSGANFTSSSQTSDFSISSVSGSGAVYDLTLSATQVTRAYTLVANRSAIFDLATTPNALGCPNNADFTGNEQLKLNAASCVDRNSVIATFSKPILTGLNLVNSAECTTPAECAKRYQLTGVSSLGNIERAELLNGTNCGGAPANTSAVCITHQNLQMGGLYTLAVANAIDGDGFDNTGCGWANCSIRNFGNTENVQTAPNDKRQFTGCLQAPQYFTDGPISTDPFTDSSSFGYVTSYGGKIYVGPNSRGNSASRFNPDGSSPEVLSFTFTKDTTGATNQNAGANGGQSTNSATSRDGGIAVPPFVTIGYTGCTQNSANIATGCGPDNENGRGLFVSGSISGQEYLFITGGRSAGDNDYIYYTSDLDTVLDFNFMDYQDPWSSVTGNQGTESLVVSKDRLYWMSPGDRSWRPYFMKTNSLTAQHNTTSATLMQLRWMSGFGYSGTPYNRADKVGGTVFEFSNGANSRVYIANSGAITNSSGNCGLNTTYNGVSCQQLGGIIRSTNDNPGACTAADTCPNWVDITPTSLKFRQYFTNVLTKLADLIPAERPIPAMAQFNNNLYMIRNACLTSRWNWTCTTDNCNDDQPCPAGEEIPQLWKCTPSGGSGTECSAGDWSLVAEDGSTGKTNLGLADNAKLSLLVRNGSRLYMGFDNPSGARMYRTKAGITNPSSANDFELVGTAGLGDPTNNREFYSSTSLSQDGVHYLYVTVGRSSGFPAQPLRVYRNMND